MSFHPVISIKLLTFAKVNKKNEFGTMTLEIGLTSTVAMQVCEEKTAAAVGSGDLPVLATPMMIALMERAAVSAISPAMEPVLTSVGTRVEVSHVKATPVGQTVRATATLTGMERRQLDFRVEARNETGELLGEGMHRRVIVEREKFMGKL